MNLFKIRIEKAAVHFKLVMNANNRLVALPPRMQTVIDGYPKVASHNKLDFPKNGHARQCFMESSTVLSLHCQLTKDGKLITC